MKPEKSSGKKALQRFEEFAKRVFSFTKEEAQKAEEAAKDVAEEITKPEEPTADE